MPERAIAFSAEEAKEDDVTEEQAKGALVDAGMSGEKLAAITTDDEVTAKKVATWAEKHGGDNVAEVVESRLPSWAPSARYTKARGLADRLRR